MSEPKPKPKDLRTQLLELCTEAEALLMLDRLKQVKEAGHGWAIITFSNGHPDIMGMLHMEKFAQAAKKMYVSE